MNKRILYFAAIAALLAAGCNGCKNTSSEQGQDVTITPEAGTTYKAGDQVTIGVKYPASVKPDSIVYLVDDKRLASAKDSAAITLKTDSLPLGAKLIMAKVYQAGKSQDVTTNIVLLASKAPEELTYTVEKIFPHDTASYTEGLVYQDGVMYESGGGYNDPPPGQEKDGQSLLAKYDLATGKAIKKVMVDPKVFAEGIVVIGDKVIQLTWKEKIGYVYDKASLKLLSTFNNNVGIEGWGMTYDGNKIYMDDSSNRIWFLDKNTYQQTGFVDVYDDKGAINSINELEYINGKIYANVYETDNILVIDPKTGAVLQKIDLRNLYPNRNAGANVLNGIAYDKATGRIFITGKKWDKLFQVKFSKK